MMENRESGNTRLQGVRLAGILVGLLAVVALLALASVMIFQTLGQ